MTDWREAWEREKHAVGRAVHEAWAAEKIRQGFEDHVFDDNCPAGCPPQTHGRCSRLGCYSGRDKHHPDMLDYDDLAPHVQEYDIQTGIVGFRMGYEAGRRSRVVREAAP